jgi:hypothetical protein
MKRSINSYFGGSSQKANATRTTGTVAATAATKKAKIEYQECPFCSMKLSSDFIGMHIADRHREGNEGGEGSEGGGGTAVSVSQDINTDSLTLELNSPSPCPQPQVSLGRNSAPNAFHTILQASRRKITKMLFFLEYIDGFVFPRIFINSEREAESTKLLAGTPWKCSVKLRNFANCVGDTKNLTMDNCNLTVATNIPPEAGPISSRDKPLSIADISLLKSMIQKGFRRCMTEKAARLALELALRSSDEFLRRMPIIMLEDGMLHGGFPVAVWLMIAQTKGYTPPGVLVSICLQIFVESCASELLDCINSAPSEQDYNTLSATLPTGGGGDSVVSESDSGTTTTTTTTTLYISEMPPCPRRTLVVSILLRASYGGMACDMHLLHAAAAAWTHRLLTPAGQGVADADADADAGADSVDRRIVSNSKDYDYECLNNSKDGGAVVSSYLHNEYCSDIVQMPYGRHVLPNRSDWKCSVGDRQNIAIIIGYPTRRKCLLPPSSDQCGAAVDLSMIEDVFLNRSAVSRGGSNITNAVPELPVLISSSFIEEGVDFHCQSKMIPHIVNGLRGSPELDIWMAKLPISANNSVSDSSNRLEDFLKSSIWIFRSSTNTRQLFEGATRQEADILRCHTASLLIEKERYAGLWRLACPLVISFCKRVVTEMQHV